MIKIALILLLIVAAVGIFIPEKYLPQPPQKVHRSSSSKEYWTGLPWMGGKKKKRKYY